MIGTGTEPVMDAPEAPTRWRVTVRREWDRLWASPLAHLLAHVPSAELFRLFELYETRAAAAAIVRREPMVAGSMGQQRANPLYDKIAAMDVAIERLADRIGLTPRAAFDLGVRLADVESGGGPDLGDFGALVQAVGGATDPRLTVVEGGATG